MRALVQRVSQATVSVRGEIIGQTGPGLLVLVCAMQGDTCANATKLAAKVAKLRIFVDNNGHMNKSILDVRGSALVVSQFTLAADTSRGNRPGFSNAAEPQIAENLYEKFVHDLVALGIGVETGQFGANMAVSLVNDGPVTIWLDV